MKTLIHFFLTSVLLLCSTCLFIGCQSNGRQNNSAKLRFDEVYCSYFSTCHNADEVDSLIRLWQSVGGRSIFESVKESPSYSVVSYTIDNHNSRNFSPLLVAYILLYGLEKGDSAGMGNIYKSFCGELYFSLEYANKYFPKVILPKQIMDKLRDINNFTSHYEDGEWWHEEALSEYYSDCSSALDSILLASLSNPNLLSESFIDSQGLSIDQASLLMNMTGILHHNSIISRQAALILLERWREQPLRLSGSLNILKDNSSEDSVSARIVTETTKKIDSVFSSIPMK